ncbi:MULTISPECIES: hypothetical protein [unclassified Streptomyces]|uniref:hypothetical protein n=1 Tax=unclassified Streptomyces TaxID=2593676 RepID=UPI0038199125
MKAMVWLLFAAGIVANVSISTFADCTGVARSLVSVGTGLVCLASGAGLWLTRDKRAA